MVDVETLRYKVTQQIPEIRSINKYLIENLISGKCVSISKIDKLAKCDIDFYLPKISSNLSIIEGSNIKQIQRYDKYIIFTLSNRTTAKILFIKLGKLGNINIIKDLPFNIKDISKYTNFILMLTMDNKPYTLMALELIEEFGYAINVSDFIKLKKLGPDIEYTDETILAKYLERIILNSKKSKKVIRNFLCNQKIISGIGDYIADEALHELKIHPLSEECEFEFTDLYNIIKKIKEFISKEKNILKVYGQRRCIDCGTHISKERISRTNSFELMFFCKNCQKYKAK